MSEALELAQLQQKWAALEVEFQEAQLARGSSPEADAAWDDVKHRYVHERDFWRSHQQRNAAVLVRDYGYAADDPVVVDYNSVSVSANTEDTVTPSALGAAAEAQELR